MNYTSPIRLFDYCQISTTQLNQDNLGRIKKIIQAEFMMAANGILEVDGYSYNKNDILELLNNPDFEQIINCHLKIKQDVILLNFLESGTLAPEEIDRLIERYKGNEMMINIFSPYFASSLDYLLKKDLSLFNLEKASKYFKLDILVTYHEEENAYNSTRKFIDEQIYFFRNINKDNVKSKKNQLTIWKQHRWSEFINALPDYLYTYIDRLSGQIIDFMVTVQYVENRMCYKFSQELIKVKMSPELLHVAIKNHQIFKKRRYTLFFHIGKKQFRFKPISIWFAFIIFQILVQIATCNSRHSKTKTLPDNFIPTVQTSTIESEAKKDSPNKEKDSVRIEIKQ